mmetsp:Transcript_19850/g.42294  ORF Transcript_19850/g.42294 Transcript_19850/m.42294 type:complete len:246 (-) Transcript_19850:1256-1993(-)
MVIPSPRGAGAACTTPRCTASGRHKEEGSGGLRLRCNEGRWVGWVHRGIARGLKLPWHHACTRHRRRDTLCGCGIRRHRAIAGEQETAAVSEASASCGSHIKEDKPTEVLVSTQEMPALFRDNAIVDDGKIPEAGHLLAAHTVVPRAPDLLAIQRRDKKSGMVPELALGGAAIPQLVLKRELLIGRVRASSYEPAVQMAIGRVEMTHEDVLSHIMGQRRPTESLHRHAPWCGWPLNQRIQQVLLL